MSNVAAGLADPRSDNRPLNEQELQLMQRLFGDPLSIPMVFRTWLVNWLEISDMKLPMTSVIGLTTTLGLSAGMSGALGMLKTGSCLVWAGAGTPDNTLLCNGALYDTSAQADLFKAIGYRFGGSGTNFNVPTIAAPVTNTEWVIVT
jgi:hypothetical protein